MQDFVLHPDAAARFDEMAQDLLGRVRAFPKAGITRPASPIYPVANLGPEDLIGEIKVATRIVDGTNTEIGRGWDSHGVTVGWIESDFKELTALAEKLERTGALKDRISNTFLVNEVFTWLQLKLEGHTTEPFNGHVLRRCTESVKQFEIWIPLHMTYSRSEFAIGEVMFRTVSESMMHSWLARIPPESTTDPVTAHELKRLRSRIQASLAGVVTVTAEPTKATELAREKVQQSAALLRFLAPANFSCRIRSYCVPLGMENSELHTELFVENGKIVSIDRSVTDYGPTAWNVDQVAALTPDVLPALRSLASNQTSEFRRLLFDALLLYCRNSLEIDLSGKLVFIFAALESLLLRDSNEPIQKNLGERMAFLIGTTLDRRKAIAKNIEDMYKVRSSFIHHGGQVTEDGTIVQFLYNAWDCLHGLLSAVDTISTKSELIVALENRKFS